MRLIKSILTITVTLGVIFLSVPEVFADETSELILKLLVKKGVVTQQEVDELEAEVAKKKPEVPEDIEERIAVLEEKSKASFLSKKGYKVDIKGGAEIEFVNIQDDDDAVARDVTSNSDDSENPRFQVDKVTLRFTVMSEDETVGFSSELEMDEGDNAFFDDAYVFLKDVKLGGATHFLKAGLQNRFIRLSRIFESYPLNGTAWWQDEEFLVNYGGEVSDGWLYWRGELARANELDDKANTENGQFEMIHDDRRGSLGNTAEIGNTFVGGGGLGIKFNTADFGTDFGKFDILGFGRAGKLTDDDVSFLQGLTGYSSTETSDDYVRAGANLNYKWQNFGLMGQFIYSEDGKLERKGWYVEPYYKIPIGWRYLDSIMPAAQISWLEVDLTNTDTDARTWDREKYTFGAICQINKNLQWKNEYSINEEDTGGSDVDNDEFISQLKFSF